MVTQSVQAYAEYEQLVGGVETLFNKTELSLNDYAKSIGKSADEAFEEWGKMTAGARIVQNNADEAYKTAGLSANEYMSTVTSFSATLLQGLGGDTEAAAKIADKAIIDMSDNANKLGTDMASIQNAYQGLARDNYMMLDNLHLGYSGTAADMARLVNDSGVMGDSFKATAENVKDITFDKLIEAIHVVQTEMGITGTTAKEASTTIEGSTKAMKAAWSNLIVGIADDSQDFDTLVDNFVDSVGTMAGNIMPRIETAIGGVGKLIEKLLPVVVEAIPGILNNVLPSLLESGSNMITTLIDGIRTNAPLLVESLLAILGSLGEAIVTLAPQFVQIGFQILSNLLEGILSNMPAIMDGITTMLSNIMENIREWLPELLDMGMQIVGQLITVLLEMLPELVEIGLEIIVQLANGIAQAYPTLVPKIVDIMLQIVQILIENIPLLIDAALNLIQGFVQGLIAAIPIIIEKLPEIITSIINALLNAIPQIIDAGIQLFVAIVSNRPAIIVGIIKAIPQIIGGIIKSLLSFQKDMAQSGFDLLIRIIENLPELVETIKEKIKKLPETIMKTIEWGLKNIPEIGMNIINGIWDGISSGWNWLIDNVKKVASSLIDSAKEILGIHSPSTKFKYMGEMCVAGFDEGIDDLMKSDSITKTVNASFGTLSANARYTGTVGTTAGIDTDEIKSAVAAGAREGIESAKIETYLDNRKVTQGVDKELGNTESTKGRYGA